MGITVGQQQRRYLAFCISVLPITEKGVKKMLELIRHIKDSLADDYIGDCFKTCITRVKKSFVKGLAGEVNAVLAEFESTVAEIRGENELIGYNDAVNCPGSFENDAPSETKEDSISKRPKRKFLDVFHTSGQLLKLCILGGSKVVKNKSKKRSQCNESSESESCLSEMEASTDDDISESFCMKQENECDLKYNNTTKQRRKPLREVSKNSAC